MAGQRPRRRQVAAERRLTVECCEPVPQPWSSGPLERKLARDRVVFGRNRAPIRAPMPHPKAGTKQAVGEPRWSRRGGSAMHWFGTLIARSMMAEGGRVGWLASLDRRAFPSFCIINPW